LGYYKNHFTKKSLLNLFLVIAFPIHAWSIYLVLRDASWVMERTNAADVYGYGSYALVVAFAESVFVFLVMLLLSLLTPKRWKGSQLMTILGSLSLAVSFWTIMNQVYYVYDEVNPNKLIQDIADLNHPVRISYLIIAILIVLIIASFILPMYLIDRSEKIKNVVATIFDRIAILSSLYLFLDVIGLINIIFRNGG
jgi:divalent metal cation (Fe/Co/Zn/Cd) transporter